MPAASQPVAYPSYRPFRATVAAVRPLSDHFVRVTLTGEHFDVFAEHARDQRIKIVFPQSERCYADLGVDDEEARIRGEWYRHWRALPNEHRSPFRTYTVRAIDRALRLLDVDFVTHTHDGAPSGPGSNWLDSATPGDEVIIIGPDARSEDSTAGMDWRPGSATDLLLLGDETAAPAIAGILERLPADRRATALIEVPVATDALPLTTPASADIRYLPREGREVGDLLEPELRRWATESPALLETARAPRPQELEDVDVDVETLWDSPDAPRDPGFYAWIAGEAAVIKRLRRILVTELAVDRRRVAFMGYWRYGQAERIG